MDSDNSVQQLIHVRCWNLLTPALSSCEAYPKYPPSHLDPTLRLEAVKGRIVSELAHKRPIMCFQELPLDWCGSLATLFAANNYAFAYSMTNRKGEARWGLGFAFPEDVYRRETQVSVRLGHFIGERREGEPTVDDIAPGSKCPNTDLDEATNTSHEVMAVRLRLLSTQQTLVVATTHLICQFMRPNVMALQGCAVFEMVSRIAAGAPTVVVGDFNPRKDTVWYPFFKSGTLPPAMAVDNPYAARLRLVRPYQEAYDHPDLGQKKSITTFASNRFNAKKFPQGFSAHIDHIFYNNGLVLTEVVKLPCSPDEISWLPNGKEPSDHLMIGASFML